MSIAMKTGWIAAVVLSSAMSACGQGVQEEPASTASMKKTAATEMEKHLSEQAGFVLYKPKGWTVSEGVEHGCRSLSVTDPDGCFEAAMVYGICPSGDDTAALAKQMLARTGKRFPDLCLEQAMFSKEKNRIVLEGSYTGPGKVKREFRSWLSCGGGSFLCSKIEASKGKLAGARELLLTILSNIRVTKGSFDLKGPPPIRAELVGYRLQDGSASFLIPRGWTVHELGAGSFIAADAKTGFSFVSASVDILAPKMGVNVAGVPVSPYLPPHKALEFLAAYQRIATQMRFLEIISREELAGEMKRVYTAGPVAVEDFLYTCLSGGRQSKGYSMGISFGSRLGTNWNFRHITVGAPLERFDAFLPTIIAMLSSYRIDEQWASNYVAKGIERLQQMQRDTFELVSRNADQIHEMMQAAYEERQKSQDYIDYQRSGYIRGQQDWVSSMEGGTAYHTDSWGTMNRSTGEYFEGRPYDYVNFTGKNPKYREQMSPIDTRELWERHIR